MSLGKIGSYAVAFAVIAPLVLWVAILLPLLLPVYLVGKVVLGLWDDRS